MLTNKIRGFEPAKGYEEVIAPWINKDENGEQQGYCPARSTTGAAGYDIRSAEEVNIPSLWKTILKILVGHAKFEDLKPTLVPTGIKVYMPEDEVFIVHGRSSSSIKKLLLLSTGTSLIDSDYYSNPKNDGHIMVPYWNLGISTLRIPKGERIAQGLFQKYLTTDNDSEFVGKSRAGGFGSTGTGVKNK